MDWDEKIIYNYVDNFVDFPNKYALSLFFVGCNLNCPFCYNKHVVNGEGNFSLNDIIERKSRIEKCFPNFKLGLVFTGGEPTIQKSFPDIINTFRSNPLSIHSNGLILPKFENVFNSVILSLKSEDCGVPDDYTKRVKEALYYYRDCAYKQINIVKIDKYLDEYSSHLYELEEYVKKYEWEVKFAEYYKE